MDGSSTTETSITVYIYVVAFDITSFAKQEIEDPLSQVVISTEYVKIPGGKNGKYSNYSYSLPNTS